MLYWRFRAFGGRHFRADKKKPREFSILGYGFEALALMLTTEEDDLAFYIPMPR